MVSDALVTKAKMCTYSFEKKNALTLAGLGYPKIKWLIINPVLGALNIILILSTPLSGSLAPMISILKHIKIISVIKLVNVFLVWPIWQHSENIFILYIFLVVEDSIIIILIMFPS